MKKLIMSLMVAGSFAFMGNTVAVAQEVAETDKKVENVRSGFTDTTGDGICDNYDGKRPGKGLGPGNGKGEGQVSGRREGRGQGLRDGSGRGGRKLDGSGPRRGERRGLRDGSGPNCTPVN